ncbi:hypothetical protein V8F33_004413 [Rhypophila sp. PSN 637]
MAFGGVRVSIVAALSFRLGSGLEPPLGPIWDNYWGGEGLREDNHVIFTMTQSLLMVLGFDVQPYSQIPVGLQYDAYE